ncbi:hypothetical protein PQR63_02065 [Herbaspirillum rhizosphaerae]|uniref:Uncharacterized protein n=1 Tax=Herbaspirillum rhizosphaerae TaxID=346179 RepID=A0ABW8Z261_9BURK
MINLTVCFFLIGIIFSANATEVSSSILDISLSQDSLVLIIKKNESIEIMCHFHEKLDKPVLSGDGNAIIVTSSQYVLMRDLESCGEKAITLFSTPKGSGELKDVNIDANTYLALDFVSTRPLTYLATIAKLGSRKNLIKLPGAYIEGASLKALQKNSFSYTRQPRISRNGRYVSPDGEMNCRDDSYPGVWDLKMKKKVLIRSAAGNLSDSQRDAEIQMKCENLFK